MVYRIYVEKKPGLDNEARALKNEISLFCGTGADTLSVTVHRIGQQIHVHADLRGLSVDGNPSFPNQIFCGTAGTNTAFRNKFLNSHAISAFLQ